MNKMDYRQINRIILLAGILLFAVIALAGIFNLGTCPAAAVGRPCCLCGCTRDFLSMLHGSFDELRNPLSIWLFPIVVLEFIFRVVGSCVSFKKNVFWADIAIHAVIFAFLFCYNLKNLCGW